MYISEISLTKDSFSDNILPSLCLVHSFLPNQHTEWKHRLSKRLEAFLCSCRSHPISDKFSVFVYLSLTRGRASILRPPPSLSDSAHNAAPPLPRPRLPLILPLSRPRCRDCLHFSFWPSASRSRSHWTAGIRLFYLSPTLWTKSTRSDLQCNMLLYHICLGNSRLRRPAEAFCSSALPRHRSSNSPPRLARWVGNKCVQLGPFDSDAFRRAVKGDRGSGVGWLWRSRGHGVPSQLPQQGSHIFI